MIIVDREEVEAFVVPKVFCFLVVVAVVLIVVVLV